MYIDDLRFYDDSNREGHAARVYFPALFGSGFARNSDSSVNVALNYGYAVVLACFTREIAANGYLSQLGLFHRNIFNQFNLASDLMEPFRPMVDRMVVNIAPQKFEHPERLAVLQVLTQQVSIADRVELVSNAIKIYTKSIFDALNNNDVSLIRGYRCEL